MPRIALLPGDGIGPEIAEAAYRVLQAIGDFEIAEHAIGGASIDEHGTALTDAGAGGLSRVRCGPPLRRRGAQMGHDRPRRSPA